MQFLRAVSHSVGAHSSKLCDGFTDSDSDTSSDEKQPDADASTNAVVETVATPDSDMNDCNVAYTSWLYRVCDMLPPAFL